MHGGWRGACARVPTGTPVSAATLYTLRTLNRTACGSRAVP
eukprot:gene11972-10337_t